MQTATKVYFFIFYLFFSSILMAQTAILHLVHNSADTSLKVVDIWLFQNQQALKIKSNVHYRSVTTLNNIQVDIPFSIMLAKKNSISIFDSIRILGNNVISKTGIYVGFIQGSLQPYSSGYNDNIPISLWIQQFDKKIKSKDSAAISYYHGIEDSYYSGLRMGIRENLVNIYNNYSLEVEKQTSFLIESQALDENKKIATNDVPTIYLPSEYYPGLLLSNASFYPDVYLDLSIFKEKLNGKSWILFSSGMSKSNRASFAPKLESYVLSDAGDFLNIKPANTFNVQLFNACPEYPSLDIWIWDEFGTNEKLVSNLKQNTATSLRPNNKMYSGKIFCGMAAPGSVKREDCFFEKEIFIFQVTPYHIIAFGVKNQNKFEGPNNIGGLDFAVFPAMKYGVKNGVAAAFLSTVTDADGFLSLREKNGSKIGNVSFANIIVPGPNYFFFLPEDRKLRVSQNIFSTAILDGFFPFSKFQDSTVMCVITGFRTPAVPAGLDNGPAINAFFYTPSGKIYNMQTLTQLAKVNKNNIKTLTVFPNPARNEIYFDENFNKQKVAIFSSTGKLMYSSVLNKPSINVEFLSPGVYTVVSENQTGKWVGKFIKSE